MMLNSYFTMARRSLLFYKGNTIINTLGLVTGIASALAILTVIHYELSFDTFHSNSDRIYRVRSVTGTDLTISERSECRTGISYPVPAALKAEIPSLENITSMQYLEGFRLMFRRLPGLPSGNSGRQVVASLWSLRSSKFLISKGTDSSGSKEILKKRLMNLSMWSYKIAGKEIFPGGQCLGKTLRLRSAMTVKLPALLRIYPEHGFSFHRILNLL